MHRVRVAGAVVTSPNSRHGGKVFYCNKGRRHWVTDASWVTQNGFVWPDSIETVEPHVLDAFRPGQAASLRYTDLQRLMPPRNSTLEMRAIAVSTLRGTGIEVGAGANPMPLPLDCRVKYVDVYNSDDLKREAYLGQDADDLVEPEIQAYFEDLSIIDDNSIDFVVACHVIEHTINPINTIVGAWKKIRSGGHLALVVPDKLKTFDRLRLTTSLEHMIEDFRNPDETRERDKEHYQDFYRFAFPVPDQEYERTWRRKWEERYPIHYHTWTYESFLEMIHWMIAVEVLPDVVEVWHQPGIAEDECLEFWFTLRKA